MHPLAFMTTWLMGAASAGDKEARAALSIAYPALVMEIDWSLEQMRIGIVKNLPGEIQEGLRRLLGGVSIMNGDTCTKTIIKTMRGLSGEYAARIVASAALTLPKEKLLPALRDMLAVLEQEGKKP